MPFHILINVIIIIDRTIYHCLNYGTKKKLALGVSVYTVPKHVGLPIIIDLSLYQMLVVLCIIRFLDITETASSLNVNLLKVNLKFISSEKGCQQKGVHFYEFLLLILIGEIALTPFNIIYMLTIISLPQKPD